MRYNDLTDTRIEPDDTVQDSVVKLAEGNPGALTALMELLKHDDGALALLWLDSKNITGPDIWKLYKDECDHDIDAFVKRVLPE